MWSGSHPLCRTKYQTAAGLHTASLCPAGRCWWHQKCLYYYILLLCGCFVIGMSPCLCRWCVKQNRKVVRSTCSSEHSPGPWQASLSLSGYFLVLCSFQFTVLRGSGLRPPHSLHIVRGGITWRRAWCPGRRPVGGGSTSRCLVSASPRTSWH